jgi:hypothetical protein
MENSLIEVDAAQTTEKRAYTSPSIVHELKMETRAGGTPNPITDSKGVDPLGIDPLGIDPSQPR